MYVVKRLGKNGMWSAVSLIDQNGSFRGEAKFETQEEAVRYMADYLERMKTRLKITPEGYGQVKVFDNDKPIDTAETKNTTERKKKAPKAKSKSKSKTYEKQKKKTRDFKLRF